MTSVDRVKQICKERRIPISKLERDLGYANGYVGQLRKGIFPSDRLAEIAEYLDVTTEYLMTGQTGQTNLSEMSELEREIIRAFRLADSGTRAAVMKLLDVEDVEKKKDSAVSA